MKNSFSGDSRVLVDAVCLEFFFKLVASVNVDGRLRHTVCFGHLHKLVAKSLESVGWAMVLGS